MTFSLNIRLSLLFAIFFLSVRRSLSQKYLWFSCVGGNDLAASHYFQFLQVALASASKNAPSLFPVVLYSGSPDIAPSWLTSRHDARQLILLNHNLSFSKHVAKFKPGLAHHGAFLRLDIPLVVNLDRFKKMIAWLPFHSEYVLYTDVDVLFLRDIPWHNMHLPGVISIGPEDVKGLKLNSGVLLMHIPVMLNLLPGFLQFADSIKWERGAVDQGLILEYFHWHATLLDDHMNWKAYWGPNPSAIILHYHGPKPLGRCGDCISASSNHSINLECDDMLVEANLLKCRCPHYFAVLKHAKEHYSLSYCNQSKSFQDFNILFRFFQVGETIPYISCEDVLCGRLAS